MPVVVHPGPSAPAPPAVRLEVPEGWTAPPAGEALLRVGGPGPSGQEVDVVVHHRVGAPGETPDAVVAEVAARAAGGDGEVEEPFVVEVGGREWWARNVSLERNGRASVEVHLVTALDPTPEASRLVHVRGRVSGDGLDTDYDALQQVLETLAVDGSEA